MLTFKVPPLQVRLRRIGATLALALAFWYFGGHGVVAQRSVQGEWRTLSYLMPINPVHMALMYSGKVLIVSGSGNVATEKNYRAAVWDPQTNTIVTQPLAWDMFCNGMVVLSDGRPFIISGTQQYDPFHGELRTAAYDPATGIFTNLQNMAHGRWYPTVTTLADGSVMTFSGLTETGATNTTVEIYTVGTGWSTQYSAGWTPPLYPRMHLLPDGRVFYSGSGTGSRLFNPSTKTWAVGPSTKYSGTRTYGTSVLLPLSPSNNYRARVMIMGGGNPATATTEIIEPLATGAAWQYGPPMSQSRIEMNATILPNGKVLATGGSSNDEDSATASRNADLYDPISNTFSSAGANAYPRLYHSGALLLPDATVLLAGGNPSRGSYQQQMEIYSPAYLFDAVGQPATRPVITSVSAAVLGYGDAFQVSTPDAARITSAVLVRPGAPTHAFDMEQRLVELSFTAGGGVLNVTAPPNGAIAPPGYYMLFLLNDAGVPSVAQFVRLTTPLPNQAPTAWIDNPSGNVTISAGQTVSFAGRGSDPDGTIAGYSWTFPGGTPASSSAWSQDVVYSGPGTFTASLTVTDNKGLASTPVSRTVTVPDFSLTATPSSQTALPGSAANYNVAVSAGAGFSGSIGFSVNGLPSLATASFTPDTLAGSGSTTMMVSTSASTPQGTYPLTITGTAGLITHTVNVTLVVTGGDFTISITPTSKTVTRGSSTSYTVTIASSSAQQPAGNVSLSVSGVPRTTSATFAPQSVSVTDSNSKSSVLTVAPKKNAARGTYTLTITGTSTGRVHSTTATLVIQ
jgi:galactose oxidase-like protein/PKD domain-containing protein